MAITIRPYQECDLNDVLSIWEEASKLAHPFLTEAFLVQERHKIPNLYLPNAKTWLAVDNNNRAVGFIALIGNEVGALFVDPEFHGQGFGRALMDTARSIHATLEVDVFKENNIGRDFYHRYGFNVQGEKVHEETGNKVLRLFYAG